MARFVYGVLVKNRNINAAEDIEEDLHKTSTVYQSIKKFVKGNGMEIENVHGGGFIGDKYQYMLVIIGKSDRYVGSVVKNVGKMFSIAPEDGWDAKLQVATDFLNNEIIKNPSNASLISDDDDYEMDTTPIAFNPGWYFINDDVANVTG